MASAQFHRVLQMKNFESPLLVSAAHFLKATQAFLVGVSLFADVAGRMPLAKGTQHCAKTSIAAAQQMETNRSSLQRRTQVTKVIAAVHRQVSYM